MVTPGLQRQHRRHLPVLPSSGRWDVGNPREEGKFAWTGFHCIAKVERTCRQVLGWSFFMVKKLTREGITDDSMGISPLRESEATMGKAGIPEQGASAAGRARPTSSLPLGCGRWKTVRSGGGGAP